MRSSGGLREGRVRDQRERTRGAPSRRGLNRKTISGRSDLEERNERVSRPLEEVWREKKGAEISHILTGKA